MLYRFDDFVLDSDRRELRRGPQLVAIPPQVFDLLQYLIKNRNRVVSKDDLIAAIWGGRIISESALSTRINVVRNAIDDTGENQRFIRTLPRKGVRFVGIVHEVQEPETPVAVAPMVQPGTALSLPDHPSIVVLPFTNMSGDPEQDYFADGMVEEIITALSRLRWLFVIARNSSFTYKGRSVDVRQVGRELGVRYVLEGSVRKSVNRVRIIGQLIDASTGAHIWADRFDGAIEDIFDLQDQVTASVVGAIAPEMEQAEIERARRKPTENLDAYDYYLQGMASVHQATKHANDDALRLFYKAIELDPNFASAYGVAAWCYAWRKLNGWMVDRGTEITETARLARQAVELGKKDAVALSMGGFALAFVMGKVEDGAAFIDQALILNPNLAASCSGTTDPPPDTGATRKAPQPPTLTHREFLAPSRWASRASPHHTSAFETKAGGVRQLARPEAAIAAVGGCPPGHSPARGPCHCRAFFCRRAQSGRRPRLLRLGVRTVSIDGGINRRVLFQGNPSSPLFWSDRVPMASLPAPTVLANPPTYELHSLGWRAFQQLCVSVAAELWGQTVQGFFDSHDGGRDGAFYGTWTSGKGETFDGSFTVQCKFSQKPGRGVSVASLAEELDKAARLTSRGLADNYFLFTNMQLTGTADEAIRAAFEAIPGLKRCRVYGVEQLSQFIRESPRLRMLVPRVYGLGDLGQILDRRAYDQAQEILSSLGDDMNKFVMTDAFRASTRAIVEHGFVLLLGEPACGKSVIAAALALGALDEWNCFTVKVRDPSEFVAASNPHEKQFFWVDDAFGATQLDWQVAAQWNATFPHIRAAIRRGAKFVFTSRDYIYKNARNVLKESALPVIQDSQVIIRVEQLSKDEREQILYNHIRLGTQPTAYKGRLKPYLDDVAAHRRFSPEIARRLGNPAFTKQLSVSASGLDDFVERPVPLLQEVIRTLDAASRAAIALVFMRGGWLASPVSLLPEEETAIGLLGATGADLRAALAPLDGSLLILIQQKGQYGWRAKHPTVLDAFASLVAESRELMDIYLAGTPVRQLLSEVACGGSSFGGVKVEVPPDRYDGLIARIKAFHSNRGENHDAVNTFLAHRCGAKFLEQFLERTPDFIGQLYVMSYFYAVTSIDVLNKLHAVALLPEDERVKHVATVRKLAVQTPDAGFLDRGTVSFLTVGEIEEILGDVRGKLLPIIHAEIDDWKDNYSTQEPPGGYFEPLKGALSAFAKALAHDAGSVALIEKGVAAVDEAIAELDSQGYDEPDDGGYHHRGNSGPSGPDLRSIFDDVDD